MKIMRNIIDIVEDYCNGCGLCELSCAQKAIEIIDGKAKLAAEQYCDGIGTCLDECPQDAIHLIERKAEDFDYDAVIQYMKTKNSYDQPKCFEQPELSKSLNKTIFNWPVKINMVSSAASFLKRADLLVVADCVTVVYPNLHHDFMKGRVMIMGCPKFNDTEEYIRKFLDIFKVADPKSLTLLIMKEPCCSPFPDIIDKSITMAKKEIPLDTLMISNQGKVIAQDSLCNPL